jgi:hypothetical protein
MITFHQLSLIFFPDFCKERKGLISDYLRGMLSKLMQLLSGKEVSRTVDDELDEQRRELEKARTDIANVKKQLRDGQNAINLLREKEEGLKSDIEKLLMEVHDPMLNREHDAEITGDASCEWEMTPFTLQSADATIQRITHEVDENSESSSSSGEDVDNERKRRASAKKNKKRLDFVTLDEHSDVDEMKHSSSDDDDDGTLQQATVAVDIGPVGSSSTKTETVTEPLLCKQKRAVARLNELREDDFVSMLEYRRWKAYFGRLQQEEMLRSYFAGTIVNDLRHRREVVESKLFERHCDLIHLQAFEEHAMRQLESYTMRGVPLADQPPSAVANVVAPEDAPVLSMEERTTSVNQ